MNVGFARVLGIIDFMINKFNELLKIPLGVFPEFPENESTKEGKGSLTKKKRKNFIKFSLFLFFLMTPKICA